MTSSHRWPRRSAPTEKDTSQNRRPRPTARQPPPPSPTLRPGRCRSLAGATACIPSTRCRATGIGWRPCSALRVSPEWSTARLCSRCSGDGLSAWGVEQTAWLSDRAVQTPRPPSEMCPCAGSSADIWYHLSPSDSAPAHLPAHAPRTRAQRTFVQLVSATHKIEWRGVPWGAAEAHLALAS